MHKFDATLNANYFKEGYMKMFSRISSRMLKASNENEFINETLADIGQVMQVSRCYIFEVVDELWSNTHEWTSEGIDSVQNDLQNLNFHNFTKIGHDILYVLLEGKPYVVEDTTKLTNEAIRSLLVSQNVHSMLSIPLFSKDKIVGLLGFDQCEKSMGWPEQSINIAIILGNLINNARAYFQTQEKLQKKKAQIQELLDVFPFPIYVSDINDYSILFCNKIIRDMFDVSTLSSTPCHKAFQGLDEPCPFCTNDILKKGDPPYIWHHQNPIVGKDYKVFDRKMTWEHLDEVRLSIALDITESLRLQREQILEREANAAKGLFVANMSHELRTPLNGIIGMTYLADKANTNPATKDFLEKIQLSSKNLLGIINDILDFSKIEDAELNIECLPLNLTDIVFEAQAILQTAADNKGLYLKCIVDKNIPLTLQGDSLRLSQIILNLANNAIKFTKSGGVSLEVKSKEITEQTHHIDIIVKDTGIGISEENLNNLFTEFTQAEASTSRDYGGTGLGLAIVRRLVEQMGGNIEVQSTLGEGSAFICHIPFIKSHEKCDIKQIPQDENATENKSDITGTKVLLVEDNEINTLIATEVLEQFGCIVDNAEDGAIALKMLEQKQHYDIIIMDIQMPNMDGLEAAEYIRRQEKYNNIPIIAMSAHAMIQDHEKSLAAGMQEHITKPFVPEELGKTIYKHTSKPFDFNKK